MASVLDDESYVLVLGKGDAGLDVSRACDVDHVADVVAKLAWLRGRRERVAGVIPKVHAHEVGGRIDALQGGSASQIRRELDL